MNLSQELSSTRLESSGKLNSHPSPPSNDLLNDPADQLSKLAAHIVADASDRSVGAIRYVFRSDTGHGGE